MKDKLTGMVKNAQELKDKAKKVSQDAAKAAGTVKTAIQVGMTTGKTVVEKASQVVNKDAIGQGLEVTGKGVEIAAKGAEIASKSVGKLADTMSKASKAMKDIGGKLKGQK